MSIVIPVYNAEKYLEQTLASIYAQTYPHTEIIAVDDGSSDRSVEILRQHAPRVRLVTQANAGAAAARNRGVREARGKWIAFLDADDLWTPDKLEKQLQLCGQYAWSYTDSVFMGGVNDGLRDSAFTQKHEGYVLEELVCGNFIGTSSILVLRDVFLEAGGFSEQFDTIEDWQLWIRLAANHEIGYVHEPLARYRVHPSSTSRNTRKTLPGHLQVIQWAFGVDGPAFSRQGLKRSALSLSHSICSHIAEEENDYAYALRCAFVASMYKPYVPELWIRTVKMATKFGLSVAGLKMALGVWYVGLLTSLPPALHV